MLLLAPPPGDDLKVGQVPRAGNALRVHPSQQSLLLVEVVGDCTQQGPSLQASRVIRPLIMHPSPPGSSLGPKLSAKAPLPISEALVGESQVLRVIYE